MTPDPEEDVLRQLVGRFGVVDRGEEERAEPIGVVAHERFERGAIALANARDPVAVAVRCLSGLARWTRHDAGQHARTCDADWESARLQRLNHQRQRVYLV